MNHHPIGVMFHTLLRIFVGHHRPHHPLGPITVLDPVRRNGHVTFYVVRTIQPQDRSAT